MPSTFPNPPGFIRQYDPTQDSDVVLQLIMESFKLKDDPEGMHTLQRMREVAQQQRENIWLSPATTNMPGLVWEIDGKVVGNINIISFFDKLRHIALIANVAVSPEHQGQGIATALTKHALRYLKSKRAYQVWLQVSSDNIIAKNLYKKLGFEVVRTINNWVLDKGTWQRPTENYDLSNYRFGSRKFADWGWQKEQLLGAYPTDTRWYGNVEFNKFSPWAILNILSWDEYSSLRHFTLKEQGVIKGVISWQYGLPRADALWMALEKTTAENEQMYALIAEFLEHYWKKRSIRLEYPFGRAEGALERLGFTLSRQLDWMKLH